VAVSQSTSSNVDKLSEVEIVGLEPRRSDLARGILIARSARPLDAKQQKALWDALSAAGVTEKGDEDTDDEPERQWHAAPWLPPSSSEADPQRLALEATAEPFGIDAVWCVKVETGVDGIAWLELASVATSSAADAPEPARRTDVDAPREVVDRVFDEPQEVLYAAPDAPPPDVDETDEGDEDELDEDDIDELEVVALESHWRNGPPPSEHSVPFPIERYPDIIDDYDWESFGIAFKLAGPSLAGEESVVNAFFALWLSVYQDERSEEFEPFQRADVIHDRKHRSALMWVERFAVPATASDQVHFLLWIAARLHEIIPVAWSRFDAVDDAVKSQAQGGDGIDPFVLAGNPFADRFQRQGEEMALAWAVSQTTWSRRELAGMLVEVALEHDPDNPATAAIAERLLRRAQSFDPGSDAAGYLAIVLVRQTRLTEAISLAQTARSRDVRLLVIGEIAEHVPADLLPALELLDAPTLAATSPEDLAELTSSVARHAATHLQALLDRLPDEVALVPHLYNASFSVDRPLALAILRRVLTLPEPPRDAGEARTALVMAWNNACIHAHALGDYKLAVELADGGQRYGPENPYIYHSAACAYAAIGQIDRAIEQVSRAIEHEYEHTEKMETDRDLSPLHSDPRFAALFNEWRTRRADLN
jgi:tetratricopeptide (TPR) repeat protein